MKIVPLRLREANAFVEQHHRHNARVVSHQFSIGLVDDGVLIGVAVVGRPVARHLDNGRNAEIRRVCVSDGHANACSKLYARAKRLCQLMGYEKIVTYTLRTESGSSLRAIRAHPEKSVPPHHGWRRNGKRGQWQPAFGEWKTRWELNAGSDDDSKEVIGEVA